jgi:hypothetical protein
MVDSQVYEVKLNEPIYFFAMLAAEHFNNEKSNR